MLVRHGQYQCTIRLKRVDERVTEGSERVFADARSNLLGRFWELHDTVFCSLNLVEEPSS